VLASSSPAKRASTGFRHTHRFTTPPATRKRKAAAAVSLSQEEGASRPPTLKKTRTNTRSQTKKEAAELEAEETRLKCESWEDKTPSETRLPATPQTNEDFAVSDQEEEEAEEESKTMESDDDFMSGASSQGFMDADDSDGGSLGKSALLYIVVGRQERSS
jgi:hypothetical protein